MISTCETRNSNTNISLAHPPPELEKLMPTVIYRLIHSCIKCLLYARLCAEFEEANTSNQSDKIMVQDRGWFLWLLLF